MDVLGSDPSPMAPGLLTVLQGCVEPAEHCRWSASEVVDLLSGLQSGTALSLSPTSSLESVVLFVEGLVSTSHR